MTLEDIGESYDGALLCVTDQTACCRYPYTGEMGLPIGSWFFPNRTRVAALFTQWGFYRTRGHMVVRLHRRRGGEGGIYHCEIPDAMNVTRAIYIGLYTADTGE